MSMVHRRIVVYFVAAVVVTIGATIFFADRAVDTVVEGSRHRDRIFALSAAKFVSNHITESGARLESLLRELPAEIEEEPATALVAKTVETIAGASGLTVLDEGRRVLVAIADPGGLPPQELLLPSLRRAETSTGPIVTDLWRGVDNGPRVAIIRGIKVEEVWRAAVVNVRVDSEAFGQLFSFFLMDSQSRLQLLDSKGVAIFSTSEHDRYRSVVHGTYYTDTARLGVPSHLTCHSCHEGAGGERKPEQELLTLAPIPDSDWSITLRDATTFVASARRDALVSHIAMASVILGAFIGFFFLLRTRVLDPIRVLAKNALGMLTASVGPDGQRLILPDREVDVADEFAVLARSLETVRRSTQSGDSASAASPSRTPAGAGVDRPVGAMDEPDVGARLERAIEVAFDSMSGGVMGAGPIRSIIASVDGSLRGFQLLRAQGVTLSSDARAKAALHGAKPGAIVTARELAVNGAFLKEPHTTHAFYVHDFLLTGGSPVPAAYFGGKSPRSGDGASDAFPARLCIGLAEEVTKEELGSTLALIAAQVTSLIERNYLYEHLSSEHAQKNRMLRHLLDAEAAERKRIAREIHDETAQSLTALLLALETFPSAEDVPGQEKRLARAKEWVAQILESTDQLMRSLRPAVLDDLGLVEATRALAANVLAPAGIEFAFEVSGDERPDLPAEVENALFRVIQEATTNVVRHSGARRASVRLEILPGTVRCAFEDNGTGMDLSWLDDVQAKPRWGLLGMRERIVQIGGTITFSSVEGGGLRIELETPFDAVQKPETRDADGSQDPHHSAGGRSRPS